jgi:hypothetical protein
LELKKNRKLPDAFKVKKRRLKPTTVKQKALPKEKDVFTFLDRVFTTEMNSGMLSSSTAIPSTARHFFSSPRLHTVAARSIQREQNHRGRNFSALPYRSKIHRE